MSAQLHLELIMLSLEEGGHLNKKLRKKLEEQGKPFSMENMIYALMPDDVLELVNVSRNTAINYIAQIRVSYRKMKMEDSFR